MMRIGRTASVLIGLAFVGSAQQSTHSQGAKRVRAALEAAGTRKSAPNFELLDAHGKVAHLSDYRGRVILLDFWATTCGGCVEEIPAFIEIAATYQGRGLTTIGVAEDIAYANLKDANEAWSRVNPFVRARKISYLVLMGDSQVTRQYDIKALPLTYLIDSTGGIAATYLGVVDRENMEHNIRTLLAQDRR